MSAVRVSFEAEIGDPAFEHYWLVGLSPEGEQTVMPFAVRASIVSAPGIARVVLEETFWSLRRKLRGSCG